MSSVLLWIGIILIVVGWIAFGVQVAKFLSVKNELNKFPAKKHEMLLRRNCCRVTMMVGIALVIISLLI